MASLIARSAAPALADGGPSRDHLPLASATRRFDTILHVLETVLKDLVSAEPETRTALTRLTEALGRIVNLPPQPQETLAAFAKRLAAHMDQMPPAARALFEKQMTQQSVIIALKMLLESLKTPPMLEMLPRMGLLLPGSPGAGENEPPPFRPPVIQQPLPIAAARSHPSIAVGSAPELQVALERAYGVGDPAADDVLRPSPAALSSGQTPDKPGAPAIAAREIPASEPAPPKLAGPAEVLAQALRAEVPIPALKAATAFLAGDADALAQAVRIIEAAGDASPALGSDLPHSEAEPLPAPTGRPAAGARSGEPAMAGLPAKIMVTPQASAAPTVRLAPDEPVLRPGVQSPLSARGRDGAGQAGERPASAGLAGLGSAPPVGRQASPSAAPAGSGVARGDGRPVAHPDVQRQAAYSGRVGESAVLDGPPTLQGVPSLPMPTFAILATAPTQQQADGWDALFMMLAGTREDAATAALPGGATNEEPDLPRLPFAGSNTLAAPAEASRLVTQSAAEQMPFFETMLGEAGLPGGMGPAMEAALTGPSEAFVQAQLQSQALSQALSRMIPPFLTMPQPLALDTAVPAETVERHHRSDEEDQPPEQGGRRHPGRGSGRDCDAETGEAGATTQEEGGEGADAFALYQHLGGLA